MVVIILRRFTKSTSFYIYPRTIYSQTSEMHNLVACPCKLEGEGVPQVEIVFVWKIYHLCGDHNHNLHGYDHSRHDLHWGHDHRSNHHHGRHHCVHDNHDALETHGAHENHSNRHN